MRRLLAICSAVGLLCGALGCHSCPDHGHMHGRCDCDDGPAYGCHYETYYHGADHAAMPAPEAPKSLPKDVMPKDEGK
jgi:hypothetical protein